MDDLLSEYLSEKQVIESESVSWQSGSMQLTVTAYPADDDIPFEYVTSVRAIVLAGQRVLLMRNPEQSHILPGGRREPGETLRESLQREIAEEAGFALADAEPQFLLHFHHETPEPDNYPYPYPDFLHLVYVAKLKSVPKVSANDEWEHTAEFVALDDPLLDSVSAVQQALLKIASA